MKVKTSYVPELVTYLTVDKVYEVIQEDGDNGYLISDDGDELVIFYASCAHLDGKAWEIVE